MIAGNLRQAYGNGNNLEARANMQWADLLGAMPDASATTIAHAIAVVLGGHYDILHGIGCGIMQPETMEFNLVANPARFAEIAVAMGERVDGLSLMEAAGKSVDAVRNLLRDVGVTQRIRDFGVPEQEIPALAEP